MTDLIDRSVATFNDGLPLNAPGCESCGGSIRAVRDRFDGVPVAVIDVRHSDEDCPTLALSIARFGGITPLRNLDGRPVRQLVVRHRFDGTAGPLDEAAIAYFAGAQL